MVDIVRGIDYFLNASSGVFKDNTAGDIDADDLRSFVRSVFRPQLAHGHRLTTESNVPISTSDRSSQGTIYLTPYLHNLSGLYDGTDWVLLTVPEIAIALSVTSGSNYDVFQFTSVATPSSTNTGTDILTFSGATGWATGSLVVANTTVGGVTAGTNYFWNAASSTTGSLHTTLANALAGSSKLDLTSSVTSELRGVSLELTAWTNDSTRATGLTTQDGVYVKSGTTTRLYLGTIRASGTNVTEDSFGGSSSQVGGKRFVWNHYNRVRRGLLVFDGTDSWTYNTAAFRQANGASGNKVEYVAGLAGVTVNAEVFGMGTASVSTNAAVGVGIDSTTANSAQLRCSNLVNNGALPILARYQGYPALGYHALNWLENGGGTATVTWYGDAGAPTYYGIGLVAEIEG